MACTGLMLILFLVVHAFGNSAIYVSSKAFQHYADSLHGLPVLVFLFTVMLFAVLLTHIIFGVTLFFENRKKSRTPYLISKRMVKNSLASKTMIYSGILLLLFMLVHISVFVFHDSAIPISILVKDHLSHFFTGSFYLLSFLILALHLSHGFWSMLQTFGINTPKFNVITSKLTIIVPLIFFLIFSGVPLYFMTGIGAAY